MIDENDEIMGGNKEKMGRWNTIPGFPEKPDEPNGWSRLVTAGNG